MSLHLSNAYWRYRNINLLSITYAFRPRLRSWLTQGGRTFPWKPWVYGPWDSHPRLATHANILTRILSTCPYGHASSRIESSPTHHNDAVASVVSFSPGNFRRRITRPVSYYALFKWVAASKPTSWLSMQFHILFHLTILWDLSCRSGLFPFWQWNLSPTVWLLENDYLAFLVW